VDAPDERVMRLALEEARSAAAGGDVPVGAVIVRGDEILAGAGNAREREQDPTAHAEILALRQASRAIGSWHLEGCALVVTLEPCVMCAGAILAARIPVVVFGAWDEKAGAVGSVYDVVRDRRLNHRVSVYAGVEAQACSELLVEFFDEQRGA